MHILIFLANSTLVASYSFCLDKTERNLFYFISFYLIDFIFAFFQFVPILFVISTSSMLIMDQRTMQIKYRIPAAEIFKLSLSPYHDDIAVFHVRAVSSTNQLTKIPKKRSTTWPIKREGCCQSKAEQSLCKS